jgi:hypothetical protein
MPPGLVNTLTRTEVRGVFDSLAKGR